VTVVAEPRTLRALLVEDHQLLAQSMSLALGMEGVACTVAGPDHLSDRETLLALARETRPDVVLLDLDLGDLGDGSRLAGDIVEIGCRVLVVTASHDQDQICRALESGAVGVVAKSLPFDRLLEAALAAARGDEVLSPADRCRMLAAARVQRSRRAAAFAPFERLSQKEAEVLTALTAGKSVASIAGEWFVSEATVRSQVRGVLTKLGVGSQLEAVAHAHGSGWLAVSPSAW
jgi:two-component system nitrate/nitrite response regulator NarL